MNVRITLSHSTPIPTPYASALSVVYNQVSQNVSVTINACNITKNTHSPVVLILYFDSLLNVTTTISDTNISHTQISSANRFDAQSKCHGTSLAMVTYFSTYFAMKYNKSHLSNDWTALSVSLSSIGYILGIETQSVYLSTSQISGLSVHVIFRHMKFMYNSVTEVVYAETISTYDNDIKSLVVHFSDVVVDTNIHSQVTQNYLYSPGAIMTFVEVVAVYLSDTHFTRNVGSVIEARDTDVYMSGTVSFVFNSGPSGAALLLLGQSHLFLYPDLSAHFEYNAYKYGGAIYSFNDRVNVSDNNCTFQVLNSNLSEVAKQGPFLVFIDNIASVGHTSVSAISINECQQIQLDIKPSNLSQLYNKIFHFQENYSEDNFNYGYISSNPVRIVPCVKGKPQHNFSYLSATHNYSTFPGKTLTIGLAALDGANKSIETSVQVQFYHGQNYRTLKPSSWRLSDYENDQMLGGNNATCTNINLTIHSKNLENHSHDSYYKSTAFFSFPYEAPTFQAEIELEQCPPGFQLNNVTGVCECSSLIKKMNREYGFEFSCDIQNSVVKVPNSEAWIGCYNNYSKEQQCEVGISSSCFPGLCNYSTVSQWTSGFANICIDSREGALCSSCAHGYSVVFGSNQCYQCSYWWLFTIAIYAVAGLLLLVFLFSFKLTVSTGTLNEIVFTVIFLKMENFVVKLRQIAWLDVKLNLLTFINRNC